MSSVRQRYRDISPVTLQVVGGAVSSSLYCGEVEGLQGGLVEAFLVELYRCKLCQFTCGLKASISSHLLLRHRPPDLPYLSDGGGGVEDREEAGLQRGVSPYQLDLNGESKQSDEDEDFLLYNMLDNMSPPTCDINSEGGLQVAHTCEVSTLFEEDFPLKGGSVDLSCPIDPPSTQEEMAQSAHLKTLGLCRISATKPPSAPPPPLAPPPAPAASPPAPPSTSQPAPPPPDALTSRRREGKKKKKKGASASRPFTCPVCLKTFGSYASRNRHQQSDDGCDPRRHGNHTGQEPSKRRGRLIGQAAWKEAELTDSRQVGSQPSVPEKQKTRIKTTEKEEKKECEEVGLTCSLCHRKFCSKLTLRRHLGVHGGERPFTCQHCDYSSRLKASLLQHLRTHTGEKPYRCPQCPYASIDRSSLLRHSRTHSQERPYRCQHCDYSSIQKKSLDLHARRHHTGEAFPCQQCEYSSPDRQLLLRHVRRHHTPSQHAAL